MKFALFYEIPVARPWDRASEHRAFKDTLDMDFDYLKDSKATICGDPDQVIETAREYEKAGVDLLLCLINPYDIPHEKCMQTIELIGKHVIPELDRD